jgi:hypothetical protein
MFDQKMIDALAKFVRLLNETGADISPFMRKKSARENFAEFARLGFPKINGSGVVISSPPEGYALARLILGPSLILPEQVAAKYNCSYTEEQLGGLQETLPNIQELCVLRANGYALQASRPYQVNLIGVRAASSHLFYSKTGGWYSEAKQEFATEEFIQAAKWQKTRMAAILRSLGESFEEQEKRLQDGEHIPRAVDVADLVVMMQEVAGVRLFEKSYVRTSSFSVEGDRVYIGGTDAGSLSVRSYWGDISSRRPRLGVCPEVILDTLRA